MPNPLTLPSRDGGKANDDMTLSPLCILAAEDSASNRILLQAYLKKTPHRLDLAENGSIAVDMFGAVRYDLVFMDMEMPVMDGYTATRSIRRLEWEAGLTPTPIIALSAHETKEAMRKSREAGCTTHLVKPITKSVLLQAIWEYTKYTSFASGPLRILFAEDSTSSRIFIQSYFADTPYQLDVAENGRVAVGMYKTGRYDLVLMDVEMPGMDGAAAARAIRQWEHEQGLQPTPILALTAYARKEEVQKSLAAGCTAHLTKPITKAALLAAILEYARSSVT